MSKNSEAIVQVSNPATASLKGESMNTQNFASLEACKRLLDAGIVLETDMIWHCAHGFFELKQRGILNSSIGINYPAPCMAEVWRELPPQGCYLTANQGYYYAWIEWTDFEGHGKSCEAKENTNPADALIDLLIWVRKEASNDHT